VIHEAGRDLRTMIDNILDISRIEAGHVSVTSDWVELRPMLEELIELVEPMVTEKPVVLDLKVDPRAATRVYTDRDKLRQILKNFLSNAVKFTEQGRITLAVEAREDSQKEVALSVADTGIGIPQDKQDIIFEAFQQADGSTRRRYGGTGLGLSISRELALLLGGRIQVESAPGAGACFTLVMPVAAVAVEAEEVVSPAAPASPHVTPLPPSDSPGALPTSSVRGVGTGASGGWVLIVERDVKTLVQLASELSRRGLRIQTAADLDEALETLQEEGEGCELVLLAAGMSDEMTCATIRTLLSPNAGPHPAVAVLGDRSAKTRVADCLGAGAVEFLSKPIDPDQLTALLAEVLPDRPVPEASAAVREPIV
jgi:CheY-like chemotaxis protein/two-component sensor histidine kinase